MERPTLRVALAVACGEKKREGQCPACDLYGSSRIKIFCRLRHEWDFPLYILSAKYGLIHADHIVQSYQQKMDLSRAEELAPQVAQIMKGFDWFIYFKGGAGPEYSACIRLAADLARVPVALVGYANLGEYRACISVAQELQRGGVPPPGSVKSLELIGAGNVRRD